MPKAPTVPRRLMTRAVFGVEGALASSIYGTILVMATLSAASGDKGHPWQLAGIVSSSAFVFWIAHLYAHGLSESIELGQRIGLADLTRIGRRESGIVIAAIPPTAALLLGALGVFAEGTAVWLAFGTGLAMLAGQGLRYARVEHFGRADRLKAVAGNVALGLLVVGLEVFLVH